MTLLQTARKSHCTMTGMIQELARVYNKRRLAKNRIGIVSDGAGSVEGIVA